LCSSCAQAHLIPDFSNPLSQSEIPLVGVVSLKRFPKRGWLDLTHHEGMASCHMDWFLSCGIAFLNLVLLLWQKVTSGHGMDIYYNVYGIELNYILAVVIVLALLIEFGIQWWESWKEQRDFKQARIKK
jgi:hypothetical protein